MKLRLAELRRQAGLNQTELATMAGISPNYISEIESGKVRNPGIWHVWQIVKALGVTVDELIEEGEYGGG